MLKKHGDWMPLGSADEQKPAADGTVEAWARSPDNPVGGWYGMKKGLRGRFANYVPPVMERLGWPRSSTSHEQPHARDLTVARTRLSRQFLASSESDRSASPSCRCGMCSAGTCPRRPAW